MDADSTDEYNAAEIRSHFKRLHAMFKGEGVKTKRAVFFFEPGSPLLCESIKPNDKGFTAFVINGAWTLRYVDGVLDACDGQHVVNSLAAKVVRTVEVPDDMRGDYNALITWAEGQK